MYDNIEDAVISAQQQRKGTSLDCFPVALAAEISQKVAGFIGELTQADGNQDKADKCFDKEQLEWSLHAINYALKNPPDYDTFRTCVYCYVKWLSVLSPHGSAKGIPSPVREDPQYYARIFLSNLSHVANNISGLGRDFLCQHVLIQVQELCKEVQPGQYVAPPINGVPQLRRKGKHRLSSCDYLSDHGSNTVSALCIWFCFHHQFFSKMCYDVFYDFCFYLWFLLKTADCFKEFFTLWSLPEKMRAS